MQLYSRIVIYTVLVYVNTILKAAVYIVNSYLYLITLRTISTGCIKNALTFER